MNPYDHYLLPYLIDGACGTRPIQRQRGKLVPRALGRVLEIGIGTGRNLPFYDQDRLEKLYGLDPALQMHRKARARMRAAGLDVELLDLPAEHIPLDNATIDTVVTTFTLCTIADAPAALREMRRVLKPEGHLLFCEHGRAPNAAVRRRQDRLTPLWKHLAGGCHLNRDIPTMLRDANFHVDDLEESYLPGPRPFSYNYLGSATVA